ncbi:hypothetical protein [Pseudoclavibacter soli]|uniref:hypothetical protein n=1 Tax=Pseudoclavibacter soli TaxID=452623 RepID=UPI0004155A0F|nr:hypothetical protein [Pseudoclavibacter soli]
MTTSNSSLTLDEATTLLEDLKTQFDQSEITNAELRGAVYGLVAPQSPQTGQRMVDSTSEFPVQEQR